MVHGHLSTDLSEVELSLQSLYGLYTSLTWMLRPPVSPVSSLYGSCNDVSLVFEVPAYSRSSLPIVSQRAFNVHVSFPRSVLVVLPGQFECSVILLLSCLYNARAMDCLLRPEIMVTCVWSRSVRYIYKYPREGKMSA